MVVAMKRPERRGSFRLRMLVAVGLLLTMTLLTGCGGSSRVVLDVRTPEEFSRIHLEGARNADIESSDFDQQVANIDHNAEVYVYCFSGVRSAKTAERLREMGFTNVTDAGGLDNAAALLNLQIVN